MGEDWAHFHNLHYIHTIHKLHFRFSSEFPGSKESYPSPTYENGDGAGAIELKRPVGAHCHGSKAQREENRDKLVAKKKLYVASLVCLVFMIGEVIGKSQVALEKKRKVTKASIHTEASCVNF